MPVTCSHAVFYAHMSGVSGIYIGIYIYTGIYICVYIVYKILKPYIVYKILKPYIVYII